MRRLCNRSLGLLRSLRKKKTALYAAVVSHKARVPLWRTWPQDLRQITLDVNFSTFQGRTIAHCLTPADTPQLPSPARNESTLVQLLHAWQTPVVHILINVNLKRFSSFKTFLLTIFTINLKSDIFVRFTVDGPLSPIKGLGSHNEGPQVSGISISSSILSVF